MVLVSCKALIAMWLHLQVSHINDNLYPRSDIILTYGVQSTYINQYTLRNMINYKFEGPNENCDCDCWRGLTRVEAKPKGALMKQGYLQVLR